MTDYYRYFFNYQANNPNCATKVKPFNEPNGDFVIYLRFHTLQMRWYYRIIYYDPKGNIINAGWRGLVISPSLNYEYQNVMPCSIGLYSTELLDPTYIDDMDNNKYMMYQSAWSNIENDVPVI